MIISTNLQSIHSNRIELVNENYSRKSRGKMNKTRGLGLFFAFTYTISPLIAVLVNSFRTIERNGAESVKSWSIDGWVVAWRGDLSYAGIPEAMSNSVIYAIICMFITNFWELQLLLPSNNSRIW